MDVGETALYTLKRVLQEFFAVAIRTCWALFGSSVVLWGG